MARVLHKYLISCGPLLSLPTRRNSQTLPHLQESLHGPLETPRPLNFQNRLAFLRDGRFLAHVVNRLVDFRGPDLAHIWNIIMTFALIGFLSFGGHGDTVSSNSQ